MAKDYPLARIGTGTKLHTLMPSGQPHCVAYFKGEPYSTDDVRPTGESGSPTCEYCLRYLGRA